jgi:hypothetical protein
MASAADPLDRNLGFLDRSVHTALTNPANAIDRWRSGFGSVTVYRLRSYLPDDIQAGIVLKGTLASPVISSHSNTILL